MTVCICKSTEVPVKRCLLFTIDFDLRHQWKGDIVFGRGEFTDFGMCSRLLSPELIAREANDGEVFMLFMKVL